MTMRDTWFGPLVVAGARAMLDRFAIAGERARLRSLTDAQLSDLGLTRKQVKREASRPFWQGTRCS